VRPIVLSQVLYPYQDSTPLAFKEQAEKSLFSSDKIYHISAFDVKNYSAGDILQLTGR
jgi:hypothetical protein